MAEIITQGGTKLALRTQPYSIEAEQAVLGGLLIAKDVWEVVSDHVREQDFHDNRHRILYRAMYRLVEQNIPIDVVTLAAALEASREIDTAGGPEYLIDLAKNTPSAANIVAYAEIVQQRSILRRLVKAAEEIAESVYQADGRTVNDLLDEAERKIFKIAEGHYRGFGPVTIQEILKQVVDRVDALEASTGGITGIATGYTDLDNMTCGLQRSDLIIVAGRPAMGKTTFALNIAEYVAMKGNGKPVLVFSMEMPSESLAMRMLSSMGRLNQTRLRTGKLGEDDWPRFSSSVAMLSETKVLIDDTPALSPIEVRARARRVMREHGGLNLIVLDYLQLMQVKSNAETRAGEISEISRSLKALAKELDVPVIALSQLNRELEKRPNKRPVMSDLRESGAIEQDADLIIFIYRDEVYHEESPEKGLAEVIIGKHRNGPIGSIRLAFHGQYCRFDNLAAGHYIDVARSQVTEGSEG